MSAEPVPFREALRLWAVIGCINFGGPAAQIALMHRMLVEERRWIGEARYLHALNYCMLLPGPEAQQLAAYAGWLMHGVKGGLAAGLLFILPGALVMLVLAAVYALYGEVAFVAALFWGVQAAVIAIVVEALVRIGRRALKGTEHFVLAGSAFAAIFFFAVPFPLIVAGAALWGFLRRNGGGGRARDETGDSGALIDRLIAQGALAHVSPKPGRDGTIALSVVAIWLVPVALLNAASAPGDVFAELARFFSVMAVVTFGGAYAVLAYVAQEAVTGFGWLAPEDMIRGLALAETTPGPLIMVVEFVGFLAAFREAGALPPLLAGAMGAGLTVWVTFAPSFLWVLAGAPYAEAVRGHARLQGALSAVTAAVVGVILNLAVWFALHVMFGNVSQAWFAGVARLYVPDLATLDIAALGIAVVSAFLLFVRHRGVIVTLGVAAVLGLVWKLAF